MNHHMVEHAIKAVTTGQGMRQAITAVGQARCWPEFFVRVVALPDDVHPDARADFLRYWTRLGWKLRSYDITEDALLFAGLRRLLPPYDGPPIDLSRGQLRSEAVGASWTSNLLVARKFALYGTRLLELCDQRGEFSESVLAADIERKGLEPRADAVVLTAPQVTAKHIICAPCLHGYDYEDEYVVDPRSLPAQVAAAAPLALSHPQSLHAPT